MNDFGLWKKDQWNKAKSFTIVEHDELDDYYWEHFEIMNGLDKATAKSIVRAWNKQAIRESYYGLSYSVGLEF